MLIQFHQKLDFMLTMKYKSMENLTGLLRACLCFCTNEEGFKATISFFSFSKGGPISELTHLFKMFLLSMNLWSLI